VSAKLRHPGKLAAQARWHRARGNDNTAAAIETLLAASGRCKVCGRLLAREDSIAIGIGPECLARINQLCRRRRHHDRHPVHALVLLV
jgi:hypothetical protein